MARARVSRNLNSISVPVPDCKFVYLHRGLQICTPSQRFINLYTFTEDYKFVYLHRGLQICTPSQRFTNLYTFTEVYKFVHLHRGLQICTPSQRFTNLYTFTEVYKFVHLQWDYKFVHLYPCRGAHSLTGVHWIPDCPGIPLQLSKTPQEAYRTQDLRQGH